MLLDNFKSAPGGTSSYGIDNTMSVGARTDGQQRFAGTIDEIRLWSSVRTSTDITSNMNNELTLPQTGLITYYKFDEGVAGGNNISVTTLNDELNNANGTLNNFTLTGNTSNWVGGSIPLALNWLEVKGNLQTGGTVELTWKVQEDQVVNYMIEKSYDAKNYTAIGNVKSNGNGINTYGYVDRYPTAGANYYRLKQFNQGGSFSYSLVIVIDASANGPAVKLYPNPATSTINIISGNQTGQLLIVDAAGKQLYNSDINGNGISQINISSWQPGQYFYSIGNNKGSFIKK